MRKKYIYYLLFILFQVSYCQVGIGITNPLGALDITSTTNGLLIPRVALTATNVTAPIVTPTASEMVYNTATAGSGLTAVTPGFYYLNTTATNWIRVEASSSSNWLLAGNAGTNPTTNFVGTTDNVDFVTRINNTERTRLTTAGRLGIGTSTPTQLLEVQGGNARINQNFIGDVGLGVGWAGFSHIGQANMTGYGFLQSNDGNFTLLNKPNTGGGYIGLRINNVDQAVLLNNGNFGIGTTAPDAKFSTVLTTNTVIAPIANFQRVGTGSTGFFKFYSGLSLNDYNSMVTPNDKAIIFSNDNDPNAQDNSGIFIGPWESDLITPRGLKIMENGNIGIGVRTPSVRLDINSPTIGAIKIVDGTQGVDKVLTSDINGVATWKLGTGFGNTKINATGTFVCPWNSGSPGIGLSTGMTVVIPSNGWYIFETGLTVQSDCNDYWLYINGFGDVWRTYCSFAGVQYMVPRDQNRIHYITAGTYPILAGKTLGVTPMDCNATNPILYIRFVKVQN